MVFAFVLHFLLLCLLVFFFLLMKSVFNQSAGLGALGSLFIGHSDAPTIQLWSKRVIMPFPFPLRSKHIALPFVSCDLILTILKQITIFPEYILYLSRFELHKPSINPSDMIHINERAFSLDIDNFLVMEVLNRSSDVFNVRLCNLFCTIIVTIQYVGPDFFELY